MLEVKLLGQFDIRRDGNPIVISSRPAQSLLAFLLLNVDIAHRREKIAGILWPNTSDENARNNLRHQLWRLRQALDDASYLQIDDVSITFNRHSEYWCDAHFLRLRTAPPYPRMN